MAFLKLFSKIIAILNRAKRSEESLELYINQHQSKSHGVLRCTDMKKGLCFLVLIFSLASCVPSPTENANEPPKFTDLHSFYTPQKITQTFLWRFTPHAPLKDSAFFLEYFGMNFQKTPEGILPLSLFGISDTLRKDSVIHESYISDSLITMYYGNPTDPLTPKIILLRDTLKVGATWIAADNLITKNGAKVSIKALVENYYSESSFGNNTFKDMYAVSYTASLKGTQIPLEPQYQNGARLDIYYARDIGDILEICKDSRDSTVFKNELIETRIR